MVTKKKVATIVVNLKKKVKMKVTEKGAEMTCNSWKAGDEITVGEILADYYKKQGVATIVKE